MSNRTSATDPAPETTASNTTAPNPTAPNPTAPNPAANPHGPATTWDVVIIGAGLAGLAAADALQGRSVVVLEASQRLGGRTFGQFWAAAGRDIDLGGTWLLPTFDYALKLLADLGIDTYDSPPSERYLTHFSAGVQDLRTPSGDDARAFDDETHRLHDRYLASGESATAAALLDTPGLPAAVRDWHIAVQRYLAGAPVEALDGGYLFMDDDDLLDPEHYKTQIVGTTRTLVEALAARSGAEIRFGSPVVAVERGPSGWTVRTVHGEEFCAPDVIVAAPRNTLRGITFTPHPAGALADLVANPHPGASRKDWFVLDGVREHFRVFASEGPFGYFRSEALLDDGGVLAVGLAPQAEGLPDAGELERAITQYLPGAHVRSHLRHDWVDERWARGTWLAYAPGDLRRMRALRPEAREDGLWFVGGDFSVEFPGTIEGAIRTGTEAARAICPR